MPHQHFSAISGGSTGAVAQLGEHLLCKEGVRSSSLLGSTNNAGRRYVSCSAEVRAVHCREERNERGNAYRE